LDRNAVFVTSGVILRPLCYAAELWENNFFAAELWENKKFAAEQWENKNFAAELWENNNFHLRNNGHFPLFPICGTMDTYCGIVTATPKSRFS
jgi:hypothetical protein